MSPPTSSTNSISLTSAKPGKKKRKTNFRPGIKAPAKKKIAVPSAPSISSINKAEEVHKPKPSPPPLPPPPLALQSTVEASASSLADAEEKPSGEASPVTDTNNINTNKLTAFLGSVGEITTTSVVEPTAPAVLANSTKKDDNEAPIESEATAKAPPTAATPAAAAPPIFKTSTKPTAPTTTGIAAAAAKRGRKRKKAGVAIRTTRSRAIVVASAASRYFSNDAASDSNNLDENNHQALIVRAAAEAVGLSSNTLGDHEDAAAGGALTRAALPDSNQNIPESNGPLLSSFCSKFPRKKTARRGKKGDKNATSAATAPAPAAAAPLQDATAAAEAAAAAAGPVVQIVNGEIVLQEDSMVVNANASTKAIDEEYTVVEEEAQLAVIGASYHSFIPNGKRSTPKRWTAAETELFYDALRQIGADFGTMEAYFAATTQRTRKQLKSKYLKEMAHVPHLIEAALHPQLKKKVDLTVFDVTVTPRPIQPPPPESSSATIDASAENEQDGNETLETAKNDSTKNNTGGGGENEPMVEEEDYDEEADAQSRRKDMLSVLPPLPQPPAAKKTTGLDNVDDYDDDFNNNGPSLWPEEEEHQGGAGGGGGDGMENDDIVHDDPLFPDEEDHDYSIMDHGDGISPKQQQQQHQQEEEPTTISLVSTAFSKKKTSKKPKFRSRKKANK